MTPIYTKDDSPQCEAKLKTVRHFWNNASDTYTSKIDFYENNVRLFTLHIPIHRVKAEHALDDCREELKNGNHGTWELDWVQHSGLQG